MLTKQFKLKNMLNQNDVGGIREPDPDKDDVGGIREPEDRGGLREPDVKGGIVEVVDEEHSILALFKRGFWIIIVIAGFFLQRYLSTEPQTCVDSGPHTCTCGSQ